MHPVDALFAAMPHVEPYPAGVVAVPDRIPGVAFFPGGAGLWGVEPGADLPPMPVGGVMALGHDFHSEAAFRQSLAQRTEVPSAPEDGYRVPPTWAALRRLLGEAGVPLTRCFFTNAYMGLRAGAETMGRFPGSRDPGFVDRCRAFFLRQVGAQRPALALTLGAWVPAFVAPLAPQLAGWRAARTMAALDTAGPVVEGVEFTGADAPACTVVALTHPSLLGPNVGRRRYKGVAGHDAELAMLREATRTSGAAHRRA